MQTKLILHRGYKGKYPENSKVAFENAINENLPFETDIRISKDNVPFLIHDETLDRLFNGMGRIKDMTSEQLEEYGYNEEESLKLFSLEELCKMICEKKYKNLIFIHIKELEDVNKVIEELKKYKISENVRFFACDNITLKLIELIKGRYPQYKVGLHVFENSNLLTEDILKKTDFLWADEISKKNIDKNLKNISKKYQLPFYAISPELIPESVFNKDIKGRWKELVELDVDGICTDKPQEFLKFE